MTRLWILKMPPLYLNATRRNGSQSQQTTCRTNLLIAFFLLFLFTVSRILCSTFLSSATIIVVNKKYMAVFDPQVGRNFNCASVMNALKNSIPNEYALAKHLSVYACDQTCPVARLGVCFALFLTLFNILSRRSRLYVYCNIVTFGSRFWIANSSLNIRITFITQVSSICSKCIFFLSREEILDSSPR